MKEIHRPAIIRPAEEDLSALAKRVHGRETKNRKQNLDHAKKQAADVLAARQKVKHGEWKEWCKEAGLSRERAGQYARFGKAVVTTAFSDLSEDEQWTEWQRISGNVRSDDRDDEEEDPPLIEPEAEAPLPPDENEHSSRHHPVDEGEIEIPEEEDIAPPLDEPDDEEELEEAPPVSPPRKYPLREAPAPPKEEHPAEKPPRKQSKGEYITLKHWSTLSPRERAALLAKEGASKFNDQTSDNIEWALWSWNPVTGCRHDCPYCYARDIANRFYEQKFEPSLWPGRLMAPRNTPFPVLDAKAWMGHKNVFVCSMADLFGRWVPREWIDAVLAECRRASQWNFLFLTKFPNRMSEFEFSDNCWVGTTVDCQARVKNAEKSFRKVKAKVKWLSCEPLIEPLEFSDIGAFQWVVIGGASRSVLTPEWHPPRRWVIDLEMAVWKTGGKVYEKTNLYHSDPGESRIREYPGVESRNVQAPASLVYLPTEIG